MSRTSSILLTIVALGAAAACAAEEPQLPNLRDVIRVTLVEQALQIEWLGPAQPPERAMTVAGPEARWNVWSPRGLGGAVPGTLEIHRPIARAADPSGFWIIGITSSPARLAITAHRGGRAVYDTSLRFTQEENGAVHLVVSDNAARKFQQARARNVVQLRAEHPQLVRSFLVPALRQLSGHDPLVPGATDVYSVFEELAPDESTTAAVRDLLPRLGHPSFTERQRASRQLDALAPQAVCAVLHMRDRDELMPEPQLRLENFLVRHSHRMIVDPRALRRDLSFLADCLEFPGDERVRWTARREIEQLTGRAIPLHHAPTEAEWSNAADVVRRQLSAPAK